MCAFSLIPAGVCLSVSFACFRCPELFHVGKFGIFGTGTNNRVNCVYWINWTNSKIARRVTPCADRRAKTKRTRTRMKSTCLQRDFASRLEVFPMQAPAWVSMCVPATQRQSRAPYSAIFRCLIDREQVSRQAVKTDRGSRYSHASGPSRQSKLPRQRYSKGRIVKIPVRSSTLIHRSLAA